MRRIALLLNYSLLIVAAVLGIESGLQGIGGLDAVFFLLAIFAPICGIVALHGPHSADWLSLYFKRRALEERQKIRELEGKESS